MKDRDLVAWIADAEAGNDAALRRWLDNTPQDKANDELERVAGLTATAPMGPMQKVLFFGFQMVFGVVYFFFRSSERVRHNLTVWIVFIPVMFAFFLLLDRIMSSSARLYQKARYAIFVLLERDKHRALPILVWIWQTASRGSDVAWRDKTAAALVQALDNEPLPRSDFTTQDRLRRLAKRLLLPSRFNRTHDLNDSEADVLASALRYLHRAQGLDNPSLLARIAALTRLPSQPNRSLVCEIAESLVFPGKKQAAQGAATVGAEKVETVEAPFPPTVAVPTASVTPELQTLHRLSQ